MFEPKVRLALILTAVLSLHLGVMPLLSRVMLANPDEHTAPENPLPPEAWGLELVSVLPSLQIAYSWSVQAPDDPRN